MKTKHKYSNRFTHGIKQAGLSFCLYAGLMYGAVITLHAAEIPVIDGGDSVDNGNRLVEAIRLANGNGEPDTIILTPGATYTLEAIEQTSDELGSSGLEIGASGLPFITSTMTIRGGKTDLGLTTIERTTSFDIPDFRIFTVLYATLRLEEVKITGGMELIGGGIYNLAGRVELSHSEISRNTANINGGGIYNDTYAPKATPEPPIYEIGYITMTDSSINNNRAFTNGGGLYNLGDARINRTSISDNRGDESSGGIENTGPDSNMEILNSTISGNRLLGKGRSVENSGAGITNSGLLSIEFSTLVNNAGPGIATTRSASSRIAYSILAGNQAAYSAGLDVEPYDCYGRLISGGYNIIGVNDSGGECNLSPMVTDLVGSDRASPVNPLLGPLANNGGPTLTHKLLAGSPAIAKVPASHCPAIDQRNILRPRGRDSYCDIGAYQVSLCDNLPLLCIGFERIGNLCAVNPFLCQKFVIPKINEIFPLIGLRVPVLRNNIIQNITR